MSDELVYKTSDAAEALNLKESVFKKYIFLLEAEGYSIPRNSSGHRVFSKKDLHTVEMLIEYSKYDGITLEKAAKEIVKRLTSDDGHNQHDVMTHENQDEYNVMTLIKSELIREIRNSTVQEIKELMLEQQKGTVTELKQFFIEQQQKIDSREKELKKEIAERDQHLQEVLKELKEIKEQLATTQEKKGFFQRLFPKN
ncbi:MAG TPA: DUF3967 domain-containing protein [Bacillus sp. (in: firmicutes)]|nr:DUF3967 domain-containing protein [Bacillus sp. (in: firmicutes)]